ncbi:MAG: cupin-like domain-containing protein [Planctomycetaceae bacterium]|nr:cupin-like domain-containing protein [Planctomycetaceae bacterium]
MNTGTLIDPSFADTQIMSRLDPLQFDAGEFGQSFSRRPFRISHSLCDNPLFELPRLLELAGQLPENHIEYNAGKLPLTVDQSLTPANGLSVEETVRRIEECESWMVIKWVHHDPAYAELLDACLRQIRPLTEQITPGMRQPQAYIFLTSPGSVTPYHIDPEHNFLLQIRGSKKVHMFDGSDSRVLSDRDFERFYSEKTRNLEFREEFRDHGWEFNLQSGQGLHFPVTFPHYVENGPEVSVSFSITFRTPDLERRRMVYQCNHRLRRMGLKPGGWGRSALADQLKYQAVRVTSKLGRMLGRGD